MQPARHRSSRQTALPQANLSWWLAHTSRALLFPVPSSLANCTAVEAACEVALVATHIHVEHARHRVWPLQVVSKGAQHGLACAQLVLTTARDLLDQADDPERLLVTFVSGDVA